MAIDPDDLIMAETLRNPVMWGQAYLTNRDGSPRRFWEHQLEDLLCEDRTIVHLDGRDIGKCLVGSTTVTDCDTGERVRLDELNTGRTLSVLGPDLKLSTTRNYGIMSNGVKPCYRLTTALGRTVEATGNHLFLTDKGWTRLDRCKRGDWIAVPRTLEVRPTENRDFSDAQLKLIAYLLADGGLGHRRVVFSKADTILVDDFKFAVSQTFPYTKVVKLVGDHYQVSTDRTKVRRRYNPCISWLRALGLMGCLSDQKFIPSGLFECSERQIALFLNRLYSCDGWFSISGKDGPSPRPEIGYCSASERLVEAVHHLLLRLGILSATRWRVVNGRKYWVLEIRSWEHIQKFARRIGFHGAKVANVEDYIGDDASHRWGQDRIPRARVKPIVDQLKGEGMTIAQITGCAKRRLRLDKANPTRATVDAYANHTHSDELHDLAASDIYWDQVVSIEPTGDQETYDLSVPEFHNFVANDIIVHNSINLTTDVLHFAFTNRGKKGLLAAPHQGQLDTLIEEIEFQLETNEDLMNSLAINKYGKPKIARKPYFRLEFSNGTILYFRPAGAYGDAFRSLHVHRIWVDEAAWLSEKAWNALRRCLVSGGRLRVYSTPNGLRNTTYYRLTMSPNVRVFRWPSWLNPHWSEETERELLEFYGGRESAGWQHEVAGEHGKPSYGAFNAEHLSTAFNDIPEYQKTAITGAELADCKSEEDTFNRLELLLNLVPQTGVFWMGGDLGYTNDPTELVVFREDPLGNQSILRLVLRVHMEHVAYPNIAQTIALLDHYFSFAGLGVDYGGNGMATVQELLTLDKYKPLALEGRLNGYHFGGTTTLAVRDGREIRKRTKELMTSLISGALQRRTLVFPNGDSDIEDEFTTHTYTLRDGRIVYSKGNDHIIDAVRCAMLANQQGGLDEVREETVSLTPVFTDPIFF